MEIEKLNQKINTRLFARSMHDNIIGIIYTDFTLVYLINEQVVKGWMLGIKYNWHNRLSMKIVVNNNYFDCTILFIF